jgi:hypothetical protein
MKYADIERLNPCVRFELISLCLNSAIDSYERILTADLPTLPFIRSICVLGHTVFLR